MSLVSLPLWNEPCRGLLVEPAIDHRPAMVALIGIEIFEIRLPQIDVGGVIQVGTPRLIGNRLDRLAPNIAPLYRIGLPALRQHQSIQCWVVDATVVAGRF